MLNAFTYMFKSKGALVKISILASTYLPALYLFYNSQILKTNFQTVDFIFFLVLSITGYLISFGYCAKCTNNLINQDNQRFYDVLPSWNGHFVDYLIIGLRKLYFLSYAPFALMPQAYNPKNMFVSEVGVDLAMEATFCRDLSNDLSPDLAYVYDDLRANLGLFYKLTTINFIVALLFVLGFVYLFWIKYYTNLLIIAASFVIAYYSLLYSYLVNFAAKNLASTSVSDLQ